ncbi:MAG: DNA repair protein RadA [Eubacteriales bacterium]|nr:DNA repair protein RadA [Eubacteriales bacterium]
MSGGFYCTECGYESRGWLGKCPGCGVWNSFVEAPKEQKSKSKKPSRSWLNEERTEVISLDQVEASEATRIKTSIEELDLVLGGGLVPGSLTLLGGEPGVGKSTLMLQVLSALEEQEEGSVLYLSGEESPGQIKLRAERLGIDPKRVRVLAATAFDELERAIDKLQPKFCFIDSIQTIYHESVEAAPGSPSQLRAVTGSLLALAKAQNISLILAGHVTKDGQIAGPRILEHMVDTVLYFEGDDSSYFRLLRAHKNRFGSVNELGVFELDSTGLHSVENPSAMALEGRPLGVPGSALTVVMEGTRPIILEIQALCTEASYTQPIRMAEGFDRNRLNLLLALLAKTGQSKLLTTDVYINVTGGFRLKERAADLAVVAAILSALEQKALADDLIVIAELGLSGELRRVQQLERRVQEAIKLGFKRFVLPAQAENSLKRLERPELEFFFASVLDEAIDRIFP